MLTAINFAQRSVVIISTIESDASGGFLSFCEDKSLELLEIYFKMQTVEHYIYLTECQLLIALHYKHAKSISPLQTQPSTVVLMSACIGHSYMI